MCKDLSETITISKQKNPQQCSVLNSYNRSSLSNFGKFRVGDLTRDEVPPSLNQDYSMSKAGVNLYSILVFTSLSADSNTKES